MVSYLILLSVVLAQCIALPNLFEKAGIAKWKGAIPIFNWFVWTKMIKAPWWWALLLCVPGVNLIMLGVFHVETANSFGKRSFAEHLQAVFIPMIYLPRLAFTAELNYLGPIDWKAMKAEGKEKGTVREWGHAIVFAVVAATLIRSFFFEAYTIPTPSMEKSLLVGDYLFVSKISYGPRLPETPVSVPFTHHTLPLTQATPSYLEWLKLPYFRLPGLGQVERFDAVVFNFPDGDTVITDMQEQGINQHARDMATQMSGANFTDTDFESAKQYILSNKKIVVRPTDKKENYIKRCVGMPGDYLEVRKGVVYIDGKAQDLPEKAQYAYNISTSDMLNPSMLQEKYAVSSTDIGQNGSTGEYNIPLSPRIAKELESNPVVKSIKKEENPKGYYNNLGLRIFPNHRNYDWSEDNYGPIHIPKAGEKINIDLNNLPIYEKAIRDYEHNTLVVNGNQILINGVASNAYTFKQNYYWMMGDNRHRSADSRFWGFVPEDHVVGKAVFIWFSKDPETGIRWNRIFSFVK